jgi:hypothetical protein
LAKTQNKKYGGSFWRFSCWLMKGREEGREGEREGKKGLSLLCSSKEGLVRS